MHPAMKDHSVPDRRDIIRQLTIVFHETFQDDTIILHDGMTAADIDEWDSLEHIVLVLAVERAFAVKLNPAEVGQLENVGKMVDLLVKKTAAAA
jgi:acyl carrier protein